MIPRSIRREHILMAIREVDWKGVPKERQSRRFLLEHNGRYYPPKYVVSLASRYATGRELNPHVFNGGKETNDFLTSLGFNVIGSSSTKRKASVSPKRENEHDACSLKSHEGVEKAQKMADGHRWRSEFREDEDPLFGRVVIAGEWGGEPERARALLEEVCSRWPNGRRVRFLITCGGFIQFSWPRHIDRRDIGDSIHPSKDAVSVLVREAESCIRSVLGEGLDKRLGKLTDYITLGVDSHKGWASATGRSATSPHIELVFLIDLRSGRLYWTGKSYPTLSQQKGLVRIADLKTHFLDLDVGKVMVLGCHDLTIFNPRSKNAKGWRKETNEGLRKLAAKERPAYVLQHPHTAVKVRTWLNAWSNLRRTLPSVRSYASAGRYHEPDRDPSEYDDLSHVLKSTKCGGAIDLIAYL